MICRLNLRRPHLGKKPAHPRRGGIVWATGPKADLEVLPKPRLKQAVEGVGFGVWGVRV